MLTGNLKRNFLLFFLILVGSSVLIFFQNCSQNADFSQGEDSIATEDTSLALDEPPLDVLPQIPPISDEGSTELLPQPPVISVLDRPAAIILGEDVKISYEIFPGGSPIKVLECLVNNQVVDCPNNRGSVQQQQPGVGDHTITIRVESEDGLKDELVISYNVVDRTRLLRQVEAILVEQEKPPLVDILFVIDNSGSMYQEQASMAAKIISFLTKIAGFDWRIAISTTDPRPTAFGGDGKLIPFPNGEYTISSALPAETARQYLAKSVQVGTGGYYYESGINSTYRAIERSLINDGSLDYQRLSGFFRKDASLVVVLISDEDEYSAFTGAKSNPENLIKLVSSTWGAKKLFKFNSIIRASGNVACTSAYYAPTYETLSKLTGGVAGDICAADYGSQLEAIGQGVVNLKRSYSLKCQPYDQNADGRPDFDIIAFNNVVLPKFQINRGVVEFVTPLPPGEYNFSYYCDNE